jgi:hypothetical protein
LDAEKAEASKKNPYFSEFETTILCHVYVSASEDPIAGNNQKGQDFRKSVLAKYNELSKEADVEDKYPKDREVISVKNGFQCQIQPTITKFNAFYKKPKVLCNMGNRRRTTSMRQVLHLRIITRSHSTLRIVLNIFGIWNMPKFDFLDTEADEFEEEVAKYFQQ